MLPFFTLAQIPTIVANSPQEVIESCEVRPLSNNLNNVPVFNSNSPELVLNEGILLSTFPHIDMANPDAHLDFAFQGEFDIFAHHVAKADPPDNLQTLYLGIIIHNPNPEPVTVEILQGASYLSQPDAPFIDLPAQLENPDGNVYAGPGSRVMSDILRGKFQEIFPPRLTIEPEEAQMVLNLPIPVKDLEPPLNGRSTYIRLRSDKPVYLASLAQFAPLDESGQERTPTLAEWSQLLLTGDLVSPRDRAPTPPNSSGSIIYGRVAGVSRGSQWKTRLTDPKTFMNLTIAPPNQALCYGISTLPGGRMGTNQVQSAPMLVRYPDTAYQGHGNYGVEYNLTLPLYNPTKTSQTVAIALETPLKQDKITDGIRFREPPSNAVFFRGTVRVSYQDEEGKQQTRYFHLVQRQGQRGEPLITLAIAPRQRREVQVDLIYPPDATPPQVLTIKTLEIDN